MKARIKEGVKGAAIYIVPISEDPVYRAVFNAVVDTFFGKELETAEQIEEACHLEGVYQGVIAEALTFDINNPPTEEDLQKIYETAKEVLEHEKCQTEKQK